MYGRQDNSGDGSSSQVPPWLVRAEVTIRHGDAVTSETVQMPPGTTTTTDAGGIRMICRWNTSEPNSTSTPTSATTSNAFPSSSSSTAGGFGFQRGNILFTSTPPERPSQRSSSGSYTLPRSGSSGNDDSISSRGRANISDSGYTSEQFTPHTYSTLPARRSSQQYNRRCKSTCSIVLSTAGADKPNPEKATSAESSKTTPSIDPWHRRPSHQHVFLRHQFSAVPEVCEDCAEGSTSSAFTTHFCTRVAEKTMNSSTATAASKDAASQTTDIESVCSSSTVKGKIRRKPGIGAYQRSEQKQEVSHHYGFCNERMQQSIHYESRMRRSSFSRKSDRPRRQLGMPVPILRLIQKNRTHPQKRTAVNASRGRYILTCTVQDLTTISAQTQSARTSAAHP